MSTTLSELLDRGYVYVDSADDNQPSQVNIRLTAILASKLHDLRIHWMFRPELRFLGKVAADSSVFETPTSFSRFILEAGIESLHLDFLNEQRIHELSTLIRSLREFGDKGFSEFWKEHHREILSRPDSEKYNQYIDLVTSESEWVYAKIKEFAEMDWPIQEVRTLFDILLAEAVKRSLRPILVLGRRWMRSLG